MYACIKGLASICSCQVPAERSFHAVIEVEPTSKISDTEMDSFKKFIVLLPSTTYTMYIRATYFPDK